LGKKLYCCARNDKIEAKKLKGIPEKASVHMTNTNEMKEGCKNYLNNNAPFCLQFEYTRLRKSAKEIGYIDGTTRIIENIKIRSRLRFPSPLFYASVKVYDSYLICHSPTVAPVERTEDERKRRTKFVTKGQREFFLEFRPPPQREDYEN
jgi:hypothetical protein